MRIKVKRFYPSVQRFDNHKLNLYSTDMTASNLVSFSIIALVDKGLFVNQENLMRGKTALLSSIHNYFTPTCTYCIMKFNAMLYLSVTKFAT